MHRCTQNQKDIRNKKQNSDTSTNNDNNNKMCDYNNLTTTEPKLKKIAMKTIWLNKRM